MSYRSIIKPLRSLRSFAAIDFVFFVVETFFCREAQLFLFRSRKLNLTLTPDLFSA